ncbi:MAG: hypothetical protein RMA76_35835 [Deltaproteobacteria bacterium]|jgi:hypothetical protein
MNTFVVVYLVVGCGAAAALVRRRRASVAEVVVMVVLWPFLVPVVFFVSTPPASDRSGRLTAIAVELDEAWRHVDLGGAEVMRAYVRRLLVAEARRAEVARAAHDARPTLLERLAPIEERAAVEVDDGLALLEETLAQLTVLRFVRTDDDEASRARVEDVLAQMEAMSSCWTTEL